MFFRDKARLLKGMEKTNQRISRLVKLEKEKLIEYLDE